MNKIDFDAIYNKPLPLDFYSRLDSPLSSSLLPVARSLLSVLELPSCSEFSCRDFLALRQAAFQSFNCADCDGSKCQSGVYPKLTPCRADFSTCQKCIKSSRQISFTLDNLFLKPILIKPPRTVKL